MAIEVADYALAIALYKLSEEVGLASAKVNIALDQLQTLNIL